MTPEQWIGWLDTNGVAMAEHADDAGVDATVQTCPGWTVRDLLAHTGMVHRWAARHLREGRDAPAEADPAAPDDGIVEWFRAGHADLVTAAREAPDDLDALTFLADAGAPRTFWIRRQAHETTVHGLDAAAAAEAHLDVDHDLAVDGIAELLEGFFARPRSRLRSDEPVSLGVVPTDADVSWRVLVARHACVVDRVGAGESDDADCVVSAAASDLYRDLWNRPPVGEVTVTGDEAVQALWRRLARVTWS